MRSSDKFRDLLSAEGVFQIPGAYDCITATMVERAGFPAVYLTGSGISLSLTAQPDLNTVSYTELRQITENIRRAVDIPMVVDIDTGFGGPLNIHRIAKDFEYLDIAAVQIEDQKSPKKCGHELGRVVISENEMIQRIRALYDNRLENGMVIIARTDARTSLGIDEAIRRGNLYLEAGADVIFVESPESFDEVKKVCKEVHGPVMFNNVEGGRSPFLSMAQLKEAGVKCSHYPNMLTRIITKKGMEMLTALKEDGTTEKMWEEMVTHKEMFAIFNHEAWVEIENKYV